jgi:hypothetical protein
MAYPGFYQCESVLKTIHQIQIRYNFHDYDVRKKIQG